jgi:heat shock protein HslJ
MVYQPTNLGNEWIEQEGPWHGVWTRRGNSNIFDARWTMPGAPAVTAILRIYVYGNFVYVQRRNSSDGNDCDYTGYIAQDGRTVSGSYRCNRGGGSWTATIIRRERGLGRFWLEQEGPWHGVWTRRGNSNIFDARWTMPGAPAVTAILTINRQGNYVSIERRHGSDGNDCTYTGTIGGDGRTVTGTYRCTRGGGSWTATIHQ